MRVKKKEKKVIRAFVMSKLAFVHVVQQQFGANQVAQMMLPQRCL